MWYNCLSEYLINPGYVNNKLCHFLFIKKPYFRFVIFTIYFDDMNLIGTSDELEKTTPHLKSEFDMKDLGKNRYCLGLEIKHCSYGILVHQLNYINMLRPFNEDKAKPFSIPMVVQTLDAKQDRFRSKDKEKQVLEPEVPHLSAISTLLYLAQCTRLDISLLVNLLTIYKNALTSRHWTGVTLKVQWIWAYSILHIFKRIQSP